MAKYNVIACHVLWRELCFYAARSRNVFDFLFLKQGWFKSYSNAAYIDLAVGDNDHYREYTQEISLLAEEFQIISHIRLRSNFGVTRSTQRYLFLMESVRGRFHQNFSPCS